MKSIFAVGAVCLALQSSLALADPAAAPLPAGPASPAAAAPPAPAPAATALSPQEQAVAAMPLPSLADVGPHKKLKIAIYEGPGGTGGASHHAMEKKAFGHDPNVDVTTLTPEDIQNGKLAGFDVLVQPGGSGHAQANALGKTGCQQIRDFVKNGGGYIGICGGAYLASDYYDWSLGIINTMVVDRAHWARGTGKVKIELTSDGKKVFETPIDEMPIFYGQGPLMAPKNDPYLPAYDQLAVFGSEIAKNGAPTGVMVNTTAIASAAYGQGRVMCISPHAEGIPAEYSLLNHAVLWVAKASAPAPAPQHLVDAEALVSMMPHATINRYGSRGEFIDWDPAHPGAQVVCSGFIALLFEHSYHLMPDDIRRWMGSSHPDAAQVYDAIVAGRGFTAFTDMGRVEPGDVIAIDFTPRQKDTGHVVLVDHAPVVLETPRDPIVTGTRQYQIDVIDSTGSGHGEADTRRLPGGGYTGGVGAGAMRFYADETSGQIVGYTWSLDGRSKYCTLPTHHVVVGRLALSQ